MMLTTKELAALLNGREIDDEITEAESKRAKENNLVVVYGASDDLMEFEGAIYDEMGAYQGTTVRLNKNGIVDCPRDADRDICYENCPYFHQVLKSAKTIKAIWGERNIDWTYETDIPHETFDIMEDGEVYCRGIVFSMDDLQC